MILLQHFLWILEGGGNLYGPVNMSYYLLSNKLTAFFCICILDSYLKQNSSSWPLFLTSWSCMTPPPVALYRLHFVFLSIMAWGHRRVSMLIQAPPSFSLQHMDHDAMTSSVRRHCWGQPEHSALLLLFFLYLWYGCYSALAGCERSIQGVHFGG